MKELIKKIVVWTLAKEAKLVLARYNPKIIAITGNMGKTSAKEAVYTALASSRFVRKSEKSLNSEFGVPLTILGLESGWNNPVKWLLNIIEGLLLVVLKKEYPKWLVLEVGADRPGDIKSIGKWLHPDVSVITGIPDVPVHVEYFDSAEEVVAEKAELVKALKKDGSLVFNGDDARVLAMRTEFEAPSITYGLESHNDISASHIQTIYENGRPDGIQFRVNYKGSSIPFYVKGGLGKTQVYPVLAACAVGISTGIDLVSIGSAFESYIPIAGRMRILRGIKEITLIDDTYNSSPIAVDAALDALAELKVNGRKIVVLGDMLELGKHSVEEHQKVGRRVADVADVLIVVGIRARGIAQGAIEAGFPNDKIIQYKQGESKKAGKNLVGTLEEGDVVFIKGSQGIRMEKTVEELLEDNAIREDLLVRQDAAWQQR